MHGAFYAVIAQLVERLSCKQRVEGLSPSGGSKADDPVKIQLGRKVEFPAGIPARLFTMRTMRGFILGCSQTVRHGALTPI